MEGWVKLKILLSKLNLKIALVVLALVLVGTWGYKFYVQEVKVNPEELLVKALDTTHALKSYRFYLEAFLETEGGHIEISKVHGEWTSPGDLHLWGKMTGQEVDIYQVKDTTYFKDPLSQRWMVTPGNNPLQQDIFLVEVNPLSILKITQVKELQYKGRQKNMSGRPYLLALRPEINNALLNAYWHNFFCNLWIDRRDLYIRQAELVAEHRQKAGDSLVIRLQLYDFNKRINIEPPQQK